MVDTTKEAFFRIVTENQGRSWNFVKWQGKILNIVFMLLQILNFCFFNFLAVFNFFFNFHFGGAFFGKTLHNFKVRIMNTCEFLLGYAKLFVFYKL